MTKSKKIILIIIILVAAIGMALFIYKDFNSVSDKTVYDPFLNIKDNKNDTKQDESVLSSNKDEQNKTNQILPNEEQTQKIVISKEQIPNLSKSIVIKTNLPEDVRKETIEKINALSNSLKNDYDSLEQWLELGLLRKLIGDYEGARDVWKFATIIRPKDAVAFHNLGFLYWQNLKDYKKSEENYLKAIENNQKDISAYIDLSNIYYFNLKDTARAKEILNRGLKNNQGNEELKRAFMDMNL